MKVSIRNKSVSIDQITYNDGLNYGRFDSSDLEIFPYEYSITKEEFITLMSCSYERCLAEIRRDDISCNDTSAFSRMNYADISSAFKHPEAFEEAIDTYFDRELFGKTLVQGEAQDFIINSTDNVKVSNAKITIIGRCFRRK